VVDCAGERDDPDIVTAGMLEAGLEELLDYPHFADAETVVSAIFMAMVAARRCQRPASWLLRSGHEFARRTMQEKHR
jgi:hypothetical protein